MTARPTPAAPLPLTVIGGFLGAGKTTLLNRILRDNRGTRYAVMVNDFGALDIDAALVEAHDGSTVALANGCVCCSIGDSLVDALIDLVSGPRAVDHVLVEASGVADPKRIADIAVVDPALARNGIVVLADVSEIRRLADDRLVGDAVRRQLAVADIVVLTKVDLVEPGAVDDTETWLAECAPRAPRIRASLGAIPIGPLLGLDAAAVATVLEPAPARGEGADAHRHEALFHRAVLRDLPIVTRARLAAFAEGLPTSVLRAKGFVELAESGQPHLLQCVGWRHSIDATPAPPDVPRGLVVIGTADMPDAATLRRALVDG
ncbi:MAG: GTP-binding protein [Ectothiorhodospiraceae bacterium]|nr:GTP-binding protein [Ectothiorhodospiraceae bacterium]